jgi:NAD(P)H dehydrogenase (quinone)
VSVAITGASGRLGQLAAEFALEKVPPAELILITRRPEALERFAARGAQVRFGDFDAPESLPAALAGAERMLLISTMDIGRRVPQHRNAVEAAVHAGVQRVVYTSGLNSTPSNPAWVVPEHAASDRLVQESGVSWTILGMGLYAEFRVSPGVVAVASGRYHHNAGEGRTAYVSRVDCAAVAAGVLVTDGHENVLYDVTGPELHTQAEVAALYSEVTGRQVEAVAVSDGHRGAEFMAAGYDEYAAGSAASWGTAIRVGALDRLSTVVADVTGRPARTLHEVLTEHRDVLLGDAA